MKIRKEKAPIFKISPPLLKNLKQKHMITDVFCAKIQQQKAVWACLTACICPSRMVPTATQFWSYTPPPRKLAFLRPRNCKFLKKTPQNSNWNKNQAKTALFCFAYGIGSAFFLSLRSRLSRTASNPTRLILPGPIDCDSNKTPVEDFPASFYLGISQ